MLDTSYCCHLLVWLYQSENLFHVTKPLFLMGLFSVIQTEIAVYGILNAQMLSILTVPWNRLLLDLICKTFQHQLFKAEHQIIFVDSELYADCSIGSLITTCCIDFIISHGSEMKYLGLSGFSKSIFLPLYGKTVPRQAY